MSGEKNALAELAWMVEESIIAARERAAIEEAARRAEAEERQRIARLTALQETTAEQIVQLQAGLRRRCEDLGPDAEAALQARAGRLLAAIRTTAHEMQIRNMAGDIARIEAEARDACAARRAALTTGADDRERGRQELDLYRARLAERKDRESLDPGGRTEAEGAVTRLADALADGQGLAAARAEAGRAVELHGRRAAAARERAADREAAAHAACGEIEALVAGLKADPTAARWRAAEVADLEALAFDAGKAAEEGRYERPAALLAQARGTVERIVSEAGAAQLAADRRDYIARAIRESLEEMGFSVAAPRPEDAARPESALLLEAVTAAGREIAVSVPVEGEVWYDLQGYPVSTEATVDGGEAVTNDAAQAILEEMHAALAEEHGVRMGELIWEGKEDPNRILRRADELPGAAERARETR